MTWRLLSGILLATVAVAAAGPREEKFSYQVNWPTGLSLGEGELTSSKDGGDWRFEFRIEASVPGFRVLDTYKSTADENLCSREFTKEFEHGNRKGKEITTFAGGKAKRVTQGGGGTSEFVVPACPQDALSFLFFVREEVKRGRVPKPQQFYYGGPYNIRVQFVGVETVKVLDAPMETERFKVGVTGPASKFEFELFLARDEARTPAMIRVPFAMGTFSMEWVR